MHLRDWSLAQSWYSNSEPIKLSHLKNFHNLENYPLFKLLLLLKKTNLKIYFDSIWVFFSFIFPLTQFNLSLSASLSPCHRRNRTYSNNPRPRLLSLSSLHMARPRFARYCSTPSTQVASSGITCETQSSLQLCVNPQQKLHAPCWRTEHLPLRARSRMPRLVASRLSSQCQPPPRQGHMPVCRQQGPSISIVVRRFVCTQSF